MSKWGGKREGAGRPSTGRSMKSIYVTDEELTKVKEYLVKLRSDDDMFVYKVEPTKHLYDSYEKAVNALRSYVGQFDGDITFDNLDGYYNPDTVRSYPPTIVIMDDDDNTKEFSIGQIKVR